MTILQLFWWPWEYIQWNYVNVFQSKPASKAPGSDGEIDGIFSWGCGPLGSDGIDVIYGWGCEDTGGLEAMGMLISCSLMNSFNLN